MQNFKQKYYGKEMNSSERTMWIKNKALESGFLAVGIAKAGKLEGVENQLADWLDKGYHGDMAYMEKHRQQRVDPTVLVPGARSVISLSYNYFTPALQKPGSPKISIYAHGKDYHKVLKKKLKTLWSRIKEEIAPGAQGRYFVDSAPVMERQWAAEAGLGWQGKNTLLIHPRTGSYFFLAEIICDLELDYDEPIPDHCGTCRRCIDACPTNAIAPEGYLVKANQCLSYLTIETKKDIPGEFSSKMENWVFGCDICQQVCPWNRFSVPHSEPQFTVTQEFLGWSPDQWKDLNEQQFETNFAQTPVKRAGFEKLKKSIGQCLSTGEGIEEGR